MAESQFTHDCAQCVFLGNHAGHDLYWCRQVNTPTIVARWGNGGPDYYSGSHVGVAGLELSTYWDGDVPLVIAAPRPGSYAELPPPPPPDLRGRVHVFDRTPYRALRDDPDDELGLPTGPHDRARWHEELQDTATWAVDDPARARGSTGKVREWREADGIAEVYVDWGGGEEGWCAATDLLNWVEARAQGLW